ncbi:TolB family protein [Candidatus Neomarinimicrobiota bacterium]
MHPQRLMVTYLLLFFPLGPVFSAPAAVARGPWLGQEPPGKTPELFGEGIISTSLDLHSCPVFSPDGRLVLWRVMNSGDANGVYFMEMVDSAWTPPRKAPFIETGPGVTNDVPWFSLDGETLYFMSDRPVGSSGRKKRIWTVDREAGAWLEPVALDALNPGDITLHWQFSISADGVFYLTGMSENGYGAYDIFKAEPDKREYAIELMEFPINSTDSDICPFIAPDESYLIFASSNRDDGYGQTDLYISFREPDGSWGAPMNMGPGINSPSQDWCPVVSHDGRYLFFTSFRNGSCHAWWVDAGIIAELRVAHQRNNSSN